MMYSKEEQRKDREKFSNIKPGGSAEVRWGEKHEPGEMSTREPRRIELGDVLLIPLVNVRTQFGQDLDHTILTGYNRYK